jgi:hypothetical protein
VALAHLQRLGAQEGARVHVGSQALAQRDEHPLGAGDVAAFEQRGLHRHVATGLDRAFGDRAHRRADLQPDVPAGADETLDRRARGLGVEPVGQQHQHIDIRVREQLAAPVATGGDQRRAGGHAAGDPQIGQRRIDQARQPARQRDRRLRARAGGGEGLQQRVLVSAELQSQAGDAVFRRARLHHRRHETAYAATATGVP